MSIEASMKIAVVLSAYDKMSKTINDAVNKSQKKLNDFANKADNISNKAFNTGRNLVTAGLVVGAPVYKAIEAAQDFETHMVDIRKQMQFDTPDSVKKMTGQVFELGRALPLATDQIQDMIASGLRMGIAEDKIVEYVKSVTKMSVAFDISAGEISDSVGKLAGIYNIPISNVEDMADAINYLDDNAKSKGRDIIDVMMRTGQASKYMKAEQSAALASTMLSLGESAETSGSGINKLVTVLGAASAMSAKTQKGFAMLGLNAKNVQKNFTFDAQNTIIDVFERINKLPKVDQATALNQLFGLEQGPKLTKLVSGLGEYVRELGLLKGAQKGSQDKEYQKRIAASAAQWQIFKNRISEVTVKAGTALLPAFNKLIGSLGKVFDKVSTFIAKNPELVSWLGKSAALFAAVSLAGGIASFAIGGAVKFVALAARAFSFLTGTIGFVVKAFQILRLVMLANPIIAIITGIAIAAFFIYKYWNTISTFFKKLWNGIKAVFHAAWEWIKRMFLSYTPQGLIIKHWAQIAAFFSGMWQKIKNIFLSGYNWVKGKFDAILSFVFGLGKRFYDAGANIINSIINGITGKVTALVNKVKGVAQKIRDFFPFSPAKEGPLKDIQRVKIVETIAQSIKPNLLASKMKTVAQNVANVGVRFSNSSGNGGGMSFNFTINLSGGATKADGDMLSARMKKEISQLMKQYNHQKERVSFS